MRIERIIINNYRQFRKADISFRKRADTDLHYLIGTNGTGKTTFLNAINYCLYGDEPHLSKESEQLPILNLQTIQNMGVGETAEICIEVRTETEDNDYVIFKRRSKFIKNSDGSISHEGDTFEVKFIDENKNAKSVTDEEANVWVERFVPKGIREFFFFDGERLDTYFKEVVGQNIQHAIFQISQIDLLENYIEKKLQISLDEYRKEAGKVNPKIEEVRSRLESARNRYSEYSERYIECDKQIKNVKEKISELDEKLKGIPDIQAIESERQILKMRFEEENEFLKTKEFEKKQVIYKNLIIVQMWPALAKSFQIIEEKKVSNEIPPQIDRSLLEGIIKENRCKVCDRPLDSDALNHVRKIVDDVKSSSEIAKQLLLMENPFYLFKDEIINYNQKITEINQNILRSVKDLETISNRREQINSQMAGYNEELISSWYKERDRYEELRDQNLKNLGVFELERTNLQEEINKYTEELNQELQKEERAKEISNKIKFCDASLKVVNKTREKIMKETREKIEQETRRQFFNLVWKRETFENIKILEDYSIKLIHKMGYDCLGSISAGERQMLCSEPQ